MASLAQDIGCDFAVVPGNNGSEGRPKCGLTMQGRLDNIQLGSLPAKALN
jgi:hypothetical protein